MKPVRKIGLRRSLRRLGPGLITGAADDDPSGIATYSQAGAQFGFSMLWTVVLTLPLMIAIQLVSARIGYITRRGLAANIKQSFPASVLWAVVSMLLVANTLNLAADIAAMAEALRLLVGGSAHIYAVTFGLLCLVLQVFMPYRAYVSWLKWLTLALLSYVAVAFMVHVDWSAVARGIVFPDIAFNHDTLLMVVAVLGTTISPYLFFWQAAQEMEDATTGQQVPARREVRRHLLRIRVDTVPWPKRRGDPVLHARRPCEGAVLVGSAQRRDRRAHHGGHDAAGIAAANDGRVRDQAAVALAWVDCHRGHGHHRGLHAGDAVEQVPSSPTSSRESLHRNSRA